MKKIAILFLSIIFIFSLFELNAEEVFIDSSTRQKAKDILLQKYKETEKLRIEKGVDQAAFLWRKEDGTRENFIYFCERYFAGTPETLEANFKKLEINFEVLNGHFNKMVLDLKRPLDLDWGKILPIDMIFGQFTGKPVEIDGSF